MYINMITNAMPSVKFIANQGIRDATTLPRAPAQRAHKYFASMYEPNFAYRSLASSCANSTSGTHLSLSKL